MPKYKVTGVGGERIVTALNEQEARHKAMVERWGDQPDPKLGITMPYRGEGLSVQKIEE